MRTEAQAQQRRHTQVDRGHPTGKDVIWPLLIKVAAQNGALVPGPGG